MDVMQEEFVQPLTGEEIIVDLCSQIASKLRTDCNLRETDAYSGGYYAKVSVTLEAYGMDTATVTAEVETGKQQDNPDELLKTDFVVPVEPALNTVRERSDQPVPMLIEEEGTPVVRQRRYVRSATKIAE